MPQQQDKNEPHYKPSAKFARSSPKTIRTTSSTRIPTMNNDISSSSISSQPSTTTTNNTAMTSPTMVARAIVACTTDNIRVATTGGGLKHMPTLSARRMASTEMSTVPPPLPTQTNINSSSSTDERDARRRKLSPKSEAENGGVAAVPFPTLPTTIQNDNVHEDDDLAVGDILADCGFSLDAPAVEEPTATPITKKADEATQQQERKDIPSETNAKQTTSVEEDQVIERPTLLSSSAAPCIPLPDPKIANVSPETFLLDLIKAMCPLLSLNNDNTERQVVEIQKARSSKLRTFWTRVSDEQVAAYTTHIVTACRTNDLTELRRLQNEQGHRLDCFNRFGESLLTMACRRGFESIVQFLLEDESVPTETLLRSCDDSGRTVLHDACWNPTPQLKICQWIMEREPALWLVADNRGCSPFQYARPEHWDVWRQFLMDNRHHLRRIQNDPDITAYFASSC